jgi:hypothetical protein
VDFTLLLALLLFSLTSPSSAVAFMCHIPLWLTSSWTVASDGTGRPCAVGGCGGRIGLLASPRFVPVKFGDWAAVGLSTPQPSHTTNQRFHTDHGCFRCVRGEPLSLSRWDLNLTLIPTSVALSGGSSCAREAIAFVVLTTRKSISLGWSAVGSSPRP